MHRISPDRPALQIAHTMLHTPMPLDEMLKIPSLKIILEAVARRHMQRRARVDVKSCKPMTTTRTKDT